MKLFKSVDEKFRKLGFKKCEMGPYDVAYRKKHKDFSYTIRIEICNMGKSGLIYCYEDDSRMHIGLTKQEAKLCLAKIKEMHRKVKP